MNESQDPLPQNIAVFLTFNQMTLQAEVDVLREILVSSMETQTKPPAITTAEIHKRVAEKVNRQLASLADHAPNDIQMLSALFESWKKVRGV